MNVPIDLNSHINISPKNLAKMAPSNKENIAFKVSVYADPNGDGYQEKRFEMFLKTSDLAGVPLYIGEWNNVVRTKEGVISKLNPKLSELTKTDAKQILEALKKADVWGTAFWRWDFQEVATDNFNLVSYNNGTLKPTKYLGILEDSVEKVYGPSVGKSTSDNAKENNLINALMKTGKLTEDEANELVTKSMQIGTDTAASDTAASDTAPDSDTTTISNTDKIDAETLSLRNDDNNTNNHSTNTNRNNPEDYDNLNELIDNIKNGDLDIDEISLNTFQNSGAYQGADEETQDCIDLAGKIGDNLGDQEIVRCSEDTNFQN